ncbi:MAG: T9SS type A sorting domain-containing protein [Paludibacteraceae bacterium]|nr:T9SS type A sorting domain-containing protein [Paludibacteraceae bacterium]
MKKTIRSIIFLLALYWCGWAGGFSSVTAQMLDYGNLRIFAYDLHYTYEGELEADGKPSVLGTYTFYFKSNVPPQSGTLVFYHSETNAELGRYDLPSSVLEQRSDAGEYAISLTKAEIPIYLTSQSDCLNMTWAIELKADKITGNRADMVDIWLKDYSNYTLQSYTYEDGYGALFAQRKEPRLLYVDKNFRCPQGIAIDKNPQSEFFGRVYIANAPTPDAVSGDAYAPGIVVLEPNPVDGKYKKVGGSYMPSGVNFPAETDQWTRFYMHSIAVNPVDGSVYYAKSASSQQSAIYQLLPDEEVILTDKGAAVNVTRNLISEANYASSSLHPINSLAFGPGGELYVLSKAGGASAIRSGSETEDVSDDKYDPGTGVIYKLTKQDDDEVYDQAEKYYNPRTSTFYGTTQEGKAQYGFPYCVSPWVDADNSMVVSSRGSFWVAQHRGKMDAYSFLAHIHPSGYQKHKSPGTGLVRYFQYSMGTGAQDTYSGNNVSPLWNVRQMLSPHTQNKLVEENHPNPTGQVALYEKDGMYSSEAFLAVAFSERVCVFKLFYNDNDTWFGFNLDWMFEIPVTGADKIDGLEFDYAGNLFVVSSTTHSLYVYSLPNYEPMQPYTYPKPSNIPAVQPMIFNSETGERQLSVSGGGNTTNTSNNLNRGTPLDDNQTVVAVAKSALIVPVDGAIVFNGDNGNQWSDTENWNIKRVPDENDIPVILRSDAVIDEAQSVSGAIFEDGSQLTITCKGGLTVGSEGIEGTASDGSSIAIHNNSGRHESVTGAGYLRIHPEVAEEYMPRVTVQYTTKSQPSEAYPTENKHRLWQYVGAPGADTEVTLTSNTWLYSWSESSGWSKQKGTVALEPFAGYAITQQGKPTYNWVATAINQPQDITLQKTAGGDNIFTNSYLAPINVAAFTADDFTGDMEKTFYVFNTGSWAEWQNATSENNGTQTTTQAAGQYTAIPVLNASNVNSNEDPTLIPPMQGVYVIANAANCTIKLDYDKHVWSTSNPGNNAMRMPDRSTTAPELLRRIRIQAYGERSGSDRMYILQDMRCTSGYDNGYDGRNMNAAGQVNIYTNEPCGEMEISSSNQIDSMYIGFCAGEDTIYTLRFSSLIGDSLYLKDVVADSIIALEEGETYSFYAPAKSVNNMRFQVLLNPDLSQEDLNPSGPGVATNIDNIPTTKLWLSDKNIYIVTGQMRNIVTIYNMSGQEVMHAQFSNQIELPISSLGMGVYVVRVNNERYKFINQE